MRNEASWTILHLKHKSLHFMDAAPAIRCQFMELGNRSSAKVQSNYWIWNDSNYYYSADDLFERPASNFSTPRRASWQVVSKIVRVVCTAIIWHLGPVYIKLPFTENEMKKLVAQFEKAHVIPQCLGAIDGTHMEIKQHAINITDHRDLHKPNSKTAL